MHTGHTEVIFNQSGAELRIQDGGAHESATLLENSIGEDLGSISMASKVSRNFKINIYRVLWSQTVMVKSDQKGGCPKASWDNKLIENQ